MALGEDYVRIEQAHAENGAGTFDWWHFSYLRHVLRQLRIMAGLRPLARETVRDLLESWVSEELARGPALGDADGSGKAGRKGGYAFKDGPFSSPSFQSSANSTRVSTKSGS